MDDGLDPCAACGNRYPIFKLKKYKIKGKQVLACPDCIKKERERVKKESSKKTPTPRRDQVKVPVIDTKPITDNQDKIVSMLLKLQESIINNDNRSSSPGAGSLNLYLSPPSVESIFHIIRSSGKIVENDLCRSFGEYYTHAKYLVLEMRVRDFIWKDAHGWLMINPTLDAAMIRDLDPWYDLHDPGDLGAYLDGLKRKAMRFKFKPVWLLSIIEQLRLLKKAFIFNIDVEDWEMLEQFENVYAEAFSLRARSRKKDKKVSDELEAKMEQLRVMLDTALLKRDGSTTTA